MAAWQPWQNLAQHCLQPTSPLDAPPASLFTPPPQALADYIEAKRRAFPRFYFVSTANLLDILSNGNTPARIMQHMSKCFQVWDGRKSRGSGGQWGAVRDSAECGLGGGGLAELWMTVEQPQLLDWFEMPA